MVYEEVNRILEDEDEDLMAEYAGFIEDLRNMERLCHILHKQRVKRGSIDFDLNESKITLDDRGKVKRCQIVYPGNRGTHDRGSLCLYAMKP